MRSQVIKIKKIECITIVYNNLTGAESPVPPISFNLSFTDYWRDSPRFSYIELTLFITLEINNFLK
ncbi:hypothetical protein FFZ99_11060 [Leptospira interrogans]|nr:hypothetical protein B2G47_00625 [Leptospira interrogans serovar Canicola]KYZ60568.1 hypothetical protein AWU66_00735 [Leptospira interrogans serovar Pomona]TQE57247.1 hypothetical protein FF006_11070 [Leptospira interrogans]OLZ32974.1 hypothetical protein AR546_02745 [Leptospira interrogans serovar Canicola]OMH73382.1 hypothetical protein BW243_00640 [Leptospira interrogans serovar Pomona]